MKVRTAWVLCSNSRRLRCLTALHWEMPECFKCRGVALIPTRRGKPSWHGCRNFPIWSWVVNQWVHCPGVTTGGGGGVIAMCLVPVTSEPKPLADLNTLWLHFFTLYLKIQFSRRCGPEINSYSGRTWNLLHFCGIHTCYCQPILQELHSNSGFQAV
jgi:hypothetical protein